MLKINRARRLTSSYKHRKETPTKELLFSAQSQNMSLNDTLQLLRGEFTVAARKLN